VRTAAREAEKILAMKHISLLVPEGAILASLEGSRQVLTQVNSLLASVGRGPLFKVQLVGLSRETSLTGGLFTANADVVLEDVAKTDLIVIPAIDGDLVRAVEANQAFVPWIIRQYMAGAEVASLCLGAFLLASTGLLNGRRCATHWLAERQFREMYPEVTLVTEKIITSERGLYSSGGAFSYLNLILYLIEKYAGREIAVMSAKVFAIEIDRESQLPFSVFSGQKDHQDAPVMRAQEFIESHFGERITVEELARIVAIGKRSLERRFKKATSNTVNEYIQRVKIEAAKKGLESGDKNVTEVMYETGYSDTKAFRNVFRKVTGVSPVEYRNKFREAAGLYA
jgi:transcriptional regulator GlxA family with amidase domain